MPVFLEAIKIVGVNKYCETFNKKDQFHQLVLLIVHRGFENVPGRAMKKTGVKYLLALDIATMDERNLTNYGDSLSGTWAWFDRAKPFGKQKLKIPDSVEIQLRLAFCSHYRNLEELQNDPDFEYLCPDLGKFTSSDFGNFKEIYELGYNYATTYLAGMRKLK